MYIFKIMYVEPRYIWKYFFDEAEIPKDYQDLIALGKDYMPYLSI